MEQMYKGIPFSPTATLTANISATDTIIPVSDVDAFPDAPSIATIGTDTTAETIIYTAKTATALTGCTRGVEGTAKDWQTDEIIGRNFTAKDHAGIIKNIEELDNKKLDATYKVDVVNTADVTAEGKALDAIQNNPNITGTLAQKVANNTQQINVLSYIDTYENLIIKMTLGETIRIGCVGDSTTQGVGTEKNYPIYIKESLKRICPSYDSAYVGNEGIAGDTTSKILNRIDSIIKNRYDMVILSIGINDLSYIINSSFTYSVKDYKENMVKIIRKFRENGIYVLVMLPLPVCGGSLNYSSRSMEIACKNVCIKENVDYIDIRESYYNMFLKGSNTPAGFSDDFVHPSGYNYRLMADLVIKHIFKLPTVEKGDLLPCYMSPFLCTDIETYEVNDGFNFKYATKIKPTDQLKYFRMFFFCKEPGLKVKAIINKTDTSATVVPIFDFDFNYKTINANSSTRENNVIVDTGLVLKYGFNIILIDPAQNNGELEIQAFQLYKG